MDHDKLLQRIASGRTDLFVDLLRSDNWQELLSVGPVKPLQWLVYYNDVTALKMVIEAGGDLSSIDIDEELANAAFFGHWKVCDFLLLNGADAKFALTDTGETPLHNALSKAGRPYYNFVVRLLLEHGADPNAATIPGKETGGFMRDVRTRGETPLHRAAAFGDVEAIRMLLDHGGDREARDANGDTPLSWASWHLRPSAVLSLLAFGDHRISEAHVERNTSDHGAGWGNGMERALMGSYDPDSTDKR